VLSYIIGIFNAGKLQQNLAFYKLWTSRTGIFLSLHAMFYLIQHYLVNRTNNFGDTYHVAIPQDSTCILIFY